LEEEEKEEEGEEEEEEEEEDPARALSGARTRGHRGAPGRMSWRHPPKKNLFYSKLLEREDFCLVSKDCYPI